MSEIRRIRQRQHLRWGTGLALFVILNFVLRALLLPVNEAEYTDGVLQMTQFSQNTGIYPPLYTALAWPFSFVVGHLWAGRLVSYIFSSASVIPIYLMTRRTFGMRAAMFAALVYTVSPVSLRWSTRVMTDATFGFFFWFALERLLTAQGAVKRDDCDRALTLACVLGAAAAMTRYQGLMLLPFTIGIAIFQLWFRGFLPWKGLLWIFTYAAVPVWSHFAGNIHGEQFLERTAVLGPWSTFINFAEPFLLSTPYFVTYPVFVLMCVGMSEGKGRRRFMMTPITAYTIAVLVIAQSLFASFQERYMLPIYGIVYIWAGLGLAVVDDRARRLFPRLRPYTPLIAVVWSLLIACIAIAGSRQAFGDVAAASRFAAEQTTGATEIYTNEIYRPATPSTPMIAASKVSFFAHEVARYLDPAYYSGEQKLPAGSIVVYTSRDDVLEFAQLDRAQHLTLLKTFQATVIPVFPDIMSDRRMEQSPIAWAYRYIPQYFYTSVYRVGPAGSR